MLTLTKFYQNIWMYIHIANIYNIIFSSLMFSIAKTNKKPSCR